MRLAPAEMRAPAKLGSCWQDGSMRYRPFGLRSATGDSAVPIQLDRVEWAAAHRQSWWSQTGSNRRPPACKAGALPTELWPLRGAVSISQLSTIALDAARVMS